MMVDQAHDGEIDERIRNGEAALRERLLPELDWDQTEDFRVVEELVSSFNNLGHEGG